MFVDKYMLKKLFIKPFPVTNDLLPKDFDYQSNRIV